jgi:hypothetical protein
VGGPGVRRRRPRGPGVRAAAGAAAGAAQRLRLDGPGAPVRGGRRRRRPGGGRRLLPAGALGTERRRLAGQPACQSVAATSGAEAVGCWMRQPGRCRRSAMRIPAGSTTGGSASMSACARTSRYIEFTNGGPVLLCMHNIDSAALCQESTRQVLCRSLPRVQDKCSRTVRWVNTGAGPRSNVRPRVGVHGRPGWQQSRRCVKKMSKPTSADACCFDLLMYHGDAW